MRSTAALHLRQLGAEIARGYAWIALLPTARSGLLLALLTFAIPAQGALGLLAAVAGWYAGRLAGASEDERPVCVFNAALTGLFAAHLWQPGTALLALVLLLGVFTGWLTVVLARLVWSSVQLPVLSVPFALAAMLALAASGSLTTLVPNAFTAPAAWSANWLGEPAGTQADSFLAAFGGIFFHPEPLAGLAVLFVVALVSRYYLLLAIGGYVAAAAWLALLGAAPEHLALTGWESNAILAALLVGGLFAAPSLTTAGLALLASVLAAWLALALARMLEPLQLLAFSLPFVFAAWLVLYAAVRNVAMAHRFNLLQPALPETAHARARLGRLRTGAPGSVPLSAPFRGSWQVSQGFDGAHTHRGTWRCALDFIVMRAGRSFSGRGDRLEDFFCYGLPVLSPAYGQVTRVVNDVPDNAPGRVNVAAHYGNRVNLRLVDGRVVVLAHLKPGSVSVTPGAWVNPGDLVGLCGNSGRSPQPHLHLHVAASDDPLAPTVPFHFAGVLVGAASSGEEAVVPESRFELAIVPQQGEQVANAEAGDVRPFFLLAGRGLRYTLAGGGSLQPDWTLRCDVDAAGRLSLVSARGARCLAESTWAVFSCYERNEVRDPAFDLWLLACGYTPVSMHVAQWEDRALPARWVPRLAVRGLAAIAWPFTASLESHYERRWDASAQAWRQCGTHRQVLSGIVARTEALIVPGLGCTAVHACVGRDEYRMQATSVYQVADIGVPGWETPLALSSMPVAGGS